MSQRCNNKIFESLLIVLTWYLKLEGVRNIPQFVVNIDFVDTLHHSRKQLELSHLTRANIRRRHHMCWCPLSTEVVVNGPHHLQAVLILQKQSWHINNNSKIVLGVFDEFTTVINQLHPYVRCLGKEKCWAVSCATCAIDRNPNCSKCKLWTLLMSRPARDQRKRDS